MSCGNENDVVHYCHNKCITSKTMLYTIATKSVQHRKRCYAYLAQKLYNIEKMLIHTCHKKRILNERNFTKLVLSTTRSTLMSVCQTLPKYYLLKHKSFQPALLGFTHKALKVSQTE